MGYKVDYGALDNWCNALGNQAATWQEKLLDVQKKLQTLSQSTHMSGKTADSLKEYIQQAHIVLLGQLMGLVHLHSSGALTYKRDYQRNIDTGLHVLIVEEELDEICGKIHNTECTAVRIGDNLFYTLNQIRDIFTLSYEDVSEVETAHRVVREYVNNLHTNIRDLETNHDNNDFLETEQMITALTNVIKELLGKDRSFRTEFSQEKLQTPTWSALVSASVEVEKAVQKQEAALKDAIANEKERVAAYKAEEEAKEDRQWAKWVAVGIAVAGSIALIVVTAGGATPLVCAGVGAAGGLATAASSGLANEYVETGSLDGMDWSEFGKNCVIGTATGFIGGYAGAISMGSAIKQPIQAGLQAAGTSAVQSVTKGTIDTIWDVGDAYISGMPGDEIRAATDENLQDMVKDTLVSGVESFAGGYVGGYFNVDASEKSFMKQLGADSVENIAKAASKNFTESAWDVGEAAWDGDSSTTVAGALKEETVDFIGGTANDFVSNEIEDLASGGMKAYQKNHKNQSDAAEVLQNIVTDTAGGTAGKFVGAVSEQTVEMIGGERNSVDVAEIWREDLDGGREIAKTAAESAGKNITEKAYEDKEFYLQMKKKADRDGNVEVVKFDKYQVLKEDYDAANKVAGKGAYKDKSVNEILGLSEKEKIDLDHPNVEKVSRLEIEESSYKTKNPTNATVIKRATIKTKLQYNRYENEHLKNKKK